MITTAMILAAGLGSRLGELTKQTPKCLVKVKGKPLIEHVITHLKRVGVTQIVVNTYHLADQVEDFLVKNSFGIGISISREPELLGTGGGVLFAKKHLAGCKNFILHNADVLSSIDLKKLTEIHEQEKNIATLAVMERETKRPLIFNDQNLLIGWSAADKASAGDLSGKKLAFTGVQVVSEQIFDLLSKFPTPSSTISAFMAASELKERVRGVTLGSSEKWFDVGTPERLKEAEESFATSLLDKDS